jgi:hypothetical protein
VSEFNEPVDLREGKPRIVFVDEVERLTGIVAVDDHARRDACTAHEGPSRYLAGELFGNTSNNASWRSRLGLA